MAAPSLSAPDRVEQAPTAFPSDFSLPALVELFEKLPVFGPIDDSLWKEPPIFPSGAGGLVSTLVDWHRFGRMLLSDGGGLLSPESMRLMTSDRLTQEQREASTLFLEGAGWGFGGAVAADGRYGWVGGTGTTGHVVPSTGAIGILLTQVQMTGPTPTTLMRRFWRYAFAAS